MLSDPCAIDGDRAIAIAWHPIDIVDVMLVHPRRTVDVRFCGFHRLVGCMVPRPNLGWCVDADNGFWHGEQTKLGEFFAQP